MGWGLRADVVPPCRPGHTPLTAFAPLSSGTKGAGVDSCLRRNDGGWAGMTGVGGVREVAGVLVEWVLVFVVLTDWGLVRMIDRPNKGALTDGIDVYRDAMRGFIVGRLRSAQGVKTVDAVERAFANSYNARDEFRSNLARNNGDIEATIDVGNFSWIICNQLNWDECFKQFFGHHGSTRTRLSSINDARIEMAHPGPGDVDRDEVHAALTQMYVVLGQINAGDERAAIEEIRDSLIPSAVAESGGGGSESAGVSVEVEDSDDDESGGKVETLLAKPVSSHRHGLMPWREVISPHPDVRSGAMTDSDFAANLRQVRDGLAGPREYSDPVEFFRRTYVTPGLRELIANSVRRINSNGGDPVIQTKTGFGGGKTHSLIALYHLVKNPAPLVAISDQADDATGKEIYSVFEEAGVEPRESVSANVAAIIGTAASTTDTEALTKEKGDPLNNLWGEMAYQLGGQEAYDIIGQASRQGTSPSEVELVRLFEHVGPSVVLMDELVLYLRNLLPEQYDYAYTFIQNLTQAVSAVKDVSLVVTLPQSRQEAGDDRGERVLDTLQSIVGRIESIRAPISTGEAFEVVRRRLFQEVKEPEELGRTCEAFAKLYSSNKRDFPRDAAQDNYVKRMRDCYPIHPEIFDRLFNDWSSIHQFQRTRGVLRLIAVCIRQLYERSDDPLIMPGDLPLDVSELNAELTKSLAFRGGGRWRPVIEEADGANSKVDQLDAGNPRFADLRGAAKRVSRTIFLGSVPGNNIHGLTKSQIHLGTAQPRQNIATYTEAINAMSRSLYYLHEGNDRYFYNTEANLNRVHAERVGKITNDEANEFIQGQLRGAIVRRRNVVVCPESSNDISESEEVRIVVLTPNLQLPSRASDTKSAEMFANDAVMHRGTHARNHRNTLVFVTGRADDLRALRNHARDHMAWVSILNDEPQGDLTTTRISELRNLIDRTRNTFNAGLITAYRYVITPNQNDPLRSEFTFSDARTNAVETGEIVGAAETTLVNKDMLADEIGTSTLTRKLEEYVWNSVNNHITVDELWRMFTDLVYFPRLRNRAVLEAAIQRGTVEGAFGYADDYDGARYVNLRFKRSLGADAALSGVSLDLFDRAALVVSQGIAEVQDLVDREAAKEAVEGDGEAGDRGYGSPDESGQDGGDVGPSPGATVAPAGPSTIRVEKKLEGEISLDAVNEIQSEIVRNLTEDGGDVVVRILVSASKAGGFSQGTVRAVRENGVQLELEVEEG